TNTKWVLFLASDAPDPEDRHVRDLLFGIHCLESSGINPADIYIYIDGQNMGMINQWISTGTNNQYNVLTVNDFFASSAQNTYENMVLFVTGHGSMNGISSPQPITPFMLLQCIKSTPNLKQAVVYLGQCYAGTFNYIGAGRGQTYHGTKGPDVIFIGATNLHESLSSSTTEALLAGNASWIANLFLLHVFKWFFNPIDVDGDGQLTIMDSYKYAGVSSNSMNKTIKIQSFVNSIGLHAQWTTAKSAHSAAPSPQTQLVLDAVQAQYVTELTINYTHQECWILNAIPAQSISI
ncbi:hypothetical protein, partial [Rahnella perminowiae]|uniref:hypothetical protein n=1 Tax=Rahnella perminowiae TaxID=2816244 RepID=UPI001EE5C417